MTDAFDIESLYRDSIIIDGAAPELSSDWPRYFEGGATGVFDTVSLHEDIPQTVENIANWYRRIKANQEKLILVENANDLRVAKDTGRLGVIMHFQNVRALGYDVSNVEVFSRLGVRVMQVAYNIRNPLGDGCLEPNDVGLSNLGEAMVREMNAQGVLVDCAHTGVKTTLDTFRVSQKPTVISHANARGVHHHPRNVTDDQLRAVKDSNGVIGLCACPFFINSKPEPTVDDLMDHLDYMTNLIGIDHVGLGIDWYSGKDYSYWIELGVWDPKNWPALPWHYSLDGGNTSKVAAAMKARGYGAEDIRKVLGLNFMRVFEDVWPKR